MANGNGEDEYDPAEDPGSEKSDQQIREDPILRGLQRNVNTERLPDDPNKK